MRLKTLFLAAILIAAPAAASLAQQAPAGQTQTAPRERAGRALSPRLFLLWRQEHPGTNFRDAWSTMTPADQRKTRADLRAKWDALPAAQQEAIKQRIQARRERRIERRQRGAQTNTSSPAAGANPVGSGTTDSDLPPSEGTNMSGTPVMLWTAVVTLLALLFYFSTGFNVGRMRGRHNIKAPAMTGHPEFERASRVQMNTLEWLVVFLPLLWLAAIYFSPAMSMAYLSWLPPVLGVVWIIGRIIYMYGYMAAPERREAGFIIAALAVLALFICDIVGIAMVWSATGAA